MNKFDKCTEAVEGCLLKILFFFGIVSLIIIAASCNPEPNTPPNLITCNDNLMVQVGADIQYEPPGNEVSCYTSGDNYAVRLAFNGNVFLETGLWRMYIHTSDLDDGTYQIVTFDNAIWSERSLNEGEAIILADAAPNGYDEKWGSVSGTITRSQNDQGNNVVCFNNVIFINLVTEETHIVSVTIIC